MYHGLVLSLINVVCCTVLQW